MSSTKKCRPDFLALSIASAPNALLFSYGYIQSTVANMMRNTSHSVKQLCSLATVKDASLWTRRGLSTTASKIRQIEVRKEILRRNMLKQQGLYSPIHL